MSNEETLENEIDPKIEKEMKKALRKNRKGIRAKLKETKEDTDAMLRTRVLFEIAEEEGWSLEYTEKVCRAKEGEELYNPEYALYWKMAQRDVAMALQTHTGEALVLKKLPEAERKIFIEKELGKSCRQGFRSQIKKMMG